MAAVIRFETQTCIWRLEATTPENGVRSCCLHGLSERGRLLAVMFTERGKSLPHPPPSGV